jgi:hypothetical protein
MKEFFRNLAAAALVAALALGTYCAPADAQTVTQLPVYVDQGVTGYKDFGNGPLELKIVQGNAIFVTSQGFGVVSSISGTLITLTATPTTPPCVNSTLATLITLNCAVGGGQITSGTLVGSYNASTGTGTGTGPSIGINNLQSPPGILAGMQLGWGGACPTSLPAGVSMPLQTGQPAGDYPMYTTARVCGYSQSGPGAMVMPFAIGAH